MSLSQGRAVAFASALPAVLVRSRLVCGSWFARGVATTSSRVPAMSATHLSAAVAAEVDRRLMGPHGYALEQLMELAGAAVAAAVADVVGLADAPATTTRMHRIAVVCGPGNNGGDGLVCARHLALFGFSDISVVCPINRFPALTTQLQSFAVPFVEEIPQGSSVIVDALFGFSFKPPVREPFPKIIRDINTTHERATLVAVDVPSGWDVDKGNIFPDDAVRTPDALVSLTAPKLCARNLPDSVRHYVGGRFVPPALCKEFDFQLPAYPGTAPIVRVPAHYGALASD